MPNQDKVVLVDVQHGVASIVLNRPERQNAWNGPMGLEYIAALEAAAADQAVRVIVVSGAGGSFCVGADPNVLADQAARDPGDPKVQPTRPYWLPLTVAKPIIGAIAGPCFGVGLQQALCFDIRYAAEDAKFSTAYARRGLVAEMGMSWLLPRIVGLAHAADLLFSARTVRAPEAERIGLANRVVPTADLLPETLAYARLLAEKCAPMSLRTMKGQLYRDLTGGLVPAYDRSNALLAEAFDWADFKEGVRSWQERRDPAFPPLAPELAWLDAPDGQ